MKKMIDSISRKLKAIEDHDSVDLLLFMVGLLLGSFFVVIIVWMAVVLFKWFILIPISLVLAAIYLTYFYDSTESQE